jgi:hypothetical protein
VSDYRLQYLDRSRKFIRQDVINAVTDDEAIAMAKEWRLARRSELWREGRLVAKFSRRPMAAAGQRR